MGVPKFFRYISERYPCLSEVVREYQLPEFDNLYLDMNGIIHVCSHPNDADPHFRITEEKIFRDIFHYIETLFRMIQPQKLFFMAVDGVAPRAKMNQQRGRRFRSAKEIETLEALAKLKGEQLPSAERFDSNCITPGTEFMTRLQAQLKYFVTFKVSTDKLWQKTKVILSGHETPGEGEHKIMDYIRYMKSEPGYDPNTRHCLYGLDADLIMLGLCTHEPNFSLLREEVKYGRKNNQKRIPTPEETTFFLLHLSLMRNYLDLEFQQLKTALSFPYNLENIIDDWVLMSFLVGNDFIPHLPDLHINKGALPILYKTYIDVLPSLGGYINEGGSLHLERFQKYMEKLAAFDFEQFKEYSADLKYFEAKTSCKPGEKKNNKNEGCLPLPPKNKDLAALIASTEELLEETEDEDDDENYTDIDSDEEDEEGFIRAEFSAMKNNYYMEKLEYVKVTPEVLRSQSEGYVRAIQWNLNYYYNGCCSWSWFYPHHYAPYISDIKDFSELKLEYDLGQPFLPFQQLLAVLPSASKQLLPKAYHDLMEDDKSPIIQFYPTEFKTDLNGKRQDWEAVVLIPFIDQESLLQAMNTKDHELTEEERSRNRHGPMQVYTYTPENLGSYMAPAFFPALANHHAKEENVPREDLFIVRSRIVKGLCPGFQRDVYFPGFPTLQHVPFTATLKNSKVKVFETPSQGDSMILTLTPQKHPEVDKVASQLLGKSVFVNWPHLFEARVVAVLSKNIRLKWNSEDDSIVSQIMDKVSKERLSLSSMSIDERYMSRLGIELGEREIIVHACTLEDKKFVMKNGKIHSEKQWSKNSVAYALQTVTTNINVYEPSKDLTLTMEQLFSPGTVVFLLEPQYFGVQGVVEGPIENQCVKVYCEMESQPNLEQFKNKLWESSRQYASGNIVGSRLNLSSHLISRITGTIYVLPSDNQQISGRKSFKLNIGLNLKFNKKNEEVCGYTRREKNGYWLYSKKAELEIFEYMKKFPEIFAYLKENTNVENVKAEDVYPDNTAEKLTELGNWLKERESNKAERQTCGTQIVEEDVVCKIEKFVDNFIKNEMTATTEILLSNPSNLYVPKPKLGQSPGPQLNLSLLDRIVNIRESYTVPLGAKGTIIGIHDVEKGSLALYDILFDKEFTGGMKIRSSPHRGYRLPGQALLKINHEKRNDSKVTPNKQFPSDKFSGSPSYQVEYKSRKQPQTDHLFKDSPGKSSNAQSWIPSAPQQLSNEYLAIYQQLQRSGPKTKSGQKVKEAVNPAVEAANALKTALNIRDDKSSADNHLQKTDSNSCSLCAELFGLHQKLGWKLPRYHYTDTSNGAIICTVVCGNGREFQGAPAYANDPAAENAAKAALQYIRAEDFRRNSVFSQTPSLQTPTLQRPGFAPVNRLPQNQNFAWIREPAQPSTLPSPPINWYTNSRPLNFQPEWKTGTTSKNFYPSAPQYHYNQLSRGQSTHYSQFNPASSRQIRPPYIPQQAGAQVRPQTSRDRYQDSTQPTTFSFYRENSVNRVPPSSAINTGPRANRPPRSRIAANFNVPFTSS